MTSLLLDLHGGLAGFDRVAPLLYPAEADGRLVRVPIDAPPLDPARLTEAADHAHATLLRREVRTWQLLVVAGLDGAPREPERGPLAGQLQRLFAQFHEPLDRNGLVPSLTWVVAVDRVGRDPVTAEPHDERARALWQHDRRGWIEEPGDLGPLYLTPADLDRLRTADAEAVRAWIAEKHEALRPHADAEAPPYTAEQLDDLGTALLAAETPRDVESIARRRLSLSALPGAVRVLRLPPLGRAAPCQSLALAHVLQMLIGDGRARDAFAPTDAHPDAAWVCTEHERDDRALADALDAYTLHLADQRRRLGGEHAHAAAVPRHDPSACGAPPAVSPLDLDLHAFGRFFDIERPRRWQTWIDETRAALDGYDTALRGQCAAYARATMTDTDPGPGETAPLDELLARREAERDAARADVRAHPPRGFPTIDLRERLYAIDRRVVHRLTRLPTRRRFALTLLTVFVLIAVPYAVLLVRVGTAWDLAGTLGALAVAAPLTVWSALRRLHRPLERDARRAHEIVREHGRRLAGAADGHLRHLGALCRLRLARRNLDLARSVREEVETRHLMARYHQHAIDRHLENAGQFRRTCVDAGPRTEPPPETAVAHRPDFSLDTPSLAFYAPRHHTAAPDGYTLTIDHAAVQPTHPILGLHSLMFSAE